MPNQDVLELCEKTIRKDLGNIDDLPYELANTVANVYYKYFDQALDIMKRASNNPGWIPKEMKGETIMEFILYVHSCDTNKRSPLSQVSGKAFSLITDSLTAFSFNAVSPSVRRTEGLA